MRDLCERISEFAQDEYEKALQELWKATGLREDGQAAARIAGIIEARMEK